MIVPLLAFYLGCHFAFASHEAGHAIAAAAYGFPVEGIKLGIGPSLKFHAGGLWFAVSPIPGDSHAAIGEGQLSVAGFFTVILAGVAVNLICAAVFGAVYYATGSNWAMALAITSLCVGATQFIGPRSDIQRAVAVYRYIQTAPAGVVDLETILPERASQRRREA